MKTIKYFASFILFFFIAIALNAQPMATSGGFIDTMNSSGKIYVVVAVLTVILIGIFIYLIGIDRKVKRLEDRAKEE